MKLEGALIGLMRLAALVSVPLFTSAQSSACSMASCLNGGRETSRNLIVAITHEGKPLRGVAVHVIGKGVERFSGATMADGTVRLVGLEPGEYWLNAEFLGIGAAYECFHVNDRSSLRAKRRLTYEWGDDAPATARIAGRLVDSQVGKGGTPLWNLTHRVDVPISRAELKLQALQRAPSTTLRPTARATLHSRQFRTGLTPCTSRAVLRVTAPTTVQTH
jgi:hypothetical protein